MTAQTHVPDWTVDRIPSLAGKTVIVTGANSGIGLEAARVFAAKGAHVVFAVRDEKRGRDAAATVIGSTEIRHLDLADLQSVRAFAEAWKDDVHILVNNAGVMVPPLGRTADGFELQFGINHLGHFALTNLLLPHISGRVVTVASSAHRSATIDFDDLNWHTRRYGSGSGGYEQSKLANLLFTLELQRRLEGSGSRGHRDRGSPRDGCDESHVQLREPRHDRLRQSGRAALRPRRRHGRDAHTLRSHRGSPRRKLRRTEPPPRDGGTAGSGGPFDAGGRPGRCSAAVGGIGRTDRSAVSRSPDATPCTTAWGG